MFLYTRLSQLCEFGSTESEIDNTDEDIDDDDEDEDMSVPDDVSPDEITEDDINTGRKKQGRQDKLDTSDDEFVPISSRKKRKGMQCNNCESSNSLEKLQRVFCCALFCLSNVVFQSIITLRENFSQLTTTMKSQFVLDWLWHHHEFNESNGNFQFKYVVGIQEVCLSAWLAVLGFSQSTFYSCRSRFFRKEKVVMPRGRLSCGLKLGIKGNMAVAWLTSFAERHTEKLPDKLKFFLPSCLCRKDVYHYFVVDMKEQGEAEEDTISFSYFLKLWRTDVLLRNITIPKASRFSICDACMLIKNKLATANTERKRDKAVKKRDIHLVEQNEECQKYYKHIQKARRNLKAYLSLIVDGMDQAKTNLPHFVELSKTAGTVWKLKAHMTGVIAHGIGHFGFFVVHHWPHGSSCSTKCPKDDTRSSQSIIPSNGQLCSRK